MVTRKTSGSAVAPPCRIAVQLVREAVPAWEENTPQVRTPEAVAEIAYGEIGLEPREVLLAVFLDIRNRLIGVYRASAGILGATVANPREVCQAALLANAAAFVLVHNHPSGDFAPSPEDATSWSVNRSAAEMLGLRCHDMVVVTASGWWHSLRENASGRLNRPTSCRRYPSERRP